jgi:predicted aconitase with swiveling domain
MTIDGHAYAPGRVEAPALVLTMALSFWGGIDPETGMVIDRSHPSLGTSIAGTILIMPGGRGSSSSSSILAECLRRSTGPAALVLAIPDPILTVGAIVAHTLYGRRCPIVVCPIDGFSNGTLVRIEAGEDGSARITTHPAGD